MIESITFKELKELNNINIIDIRSKEKYNNGHILNSMNIPIEQLLIYPNKYFNKKEKYYVYCQKGIQSKKLCQILKNNGFNVVNILGGYEESLLKNKNNGFC